MESEKEARTRNGLEEPLIKEVHRVKNLQGVNQVNDAVVMFEKKGLFIRNIVLGIDVNGTLIDTMPGVLAIMRERLGREPKPEEITTKNPLAMEAMNKVLERPDEIKLTDPRLPEILNELRKLGVRMKIVTQATEEDIPKFLAIFKSFNLPIEREDFVTATDPEKHLHANSLIDDKQINAMEKPGRLNIHFNTKAAKAGLDDYGNPLLPPYEQYKLHMTTITVTNWPDVLEFMKTLVEKRTFNVDL
ncbi:MAG: hypothetical protein KGH58_00345 [Candidatus Micrarchaeota archaeon]|nr:hypothetical protein [Candidatus Micrarchaeota archaeon]